MRAYGPLSLWTSAPPAAWATRSAGSSVPTISSQRWFMIFTSTASYGRPTRRFPTEISANPPSSLPRLRNASMRRDSEQRMASASRKSAPDRSSASRRVVVVLVPPIDELDLVGPLEVFKSVNRLAGRAIYTVEVVTSADRLSVEGEGGVLTFVARHHFRKVEGVCDSVLLVCGLGTRSVRDAALSAWLNKMAGETRRLRSEERRVGNEGRSRCAP